MSLTQQHVKVNVCGGHYIGFHPPSTLPIPTWLWFGLQNPPRDANRFVGDMCSSTHVTAPWLFAGAGQEAEDGRCREPTRA